MTIPDPNEVKHLLSVFAERPTEVLSETATLERRERATSQIYSILREPRPNQAVLFLRRRWLETSTALALAAGLALFIGHRVAAEKQVLPVASYRTLESTGQISCSNTDRSGFSRCNPATQIAIFGIRTEADAHLTIETQIGVRLALSPSSTLLLPNGIQALGKSHVALDEGKVDVLVPKLGPARQFQVLTPTAMVTVHGTAFSVTVTRSASNFEANRVAEGKPSTCVDLREGVISVESAGQVQRLNAPAQWGCGTPNSERAVMPAGVQSAPVGVTDGASTAPTVTGASNPSLVPTEAAKRRSTLAEETRLLQTALVAERSGNRLGAEKNLRALLSTYPNSVVAPDARAALERLSQLPNRRK